MKVTRWFCRGLSEKMGYFEAEHQGPKTSLDSTRPQSEDFLLKIHEKRVSTQCHYNNVNMTSRYSHQLNLNCVKGETLIHQLLNKCQNIHNGTLKWKYISILTPLLNTHHLLACRSLRDDALALLIFSTTLGGWYKIYLSIGKHSAPTAT